VLGAWGQKLFKKKNSGEYVAESKRRTIQNVFHIEEEIMSTKVE